MEAKILRTIVALVAIIALLVLGRYAGSCLVIDQPGPADAIVVLGGDHNDVRYQRGLALLQSGPAQDLLVDSNSDETQFGEPLTVQCERFLQRTAGKWTAHAHVCPIEGDSTVLETQYVARCLGSTSARNVLLVTSAFHTRRALSIFRKELPQYHWSVVAVRDESRFNERWWDRREWAKTTFLEWLKMCWWESVDRWRS
jgi:uncharacterized SAM-binding protein YcdF (DUF218 family)